jgi:lysophospholipase L1-like esterase
MISQLKYFTVLLILVLNWPAHAVTRITCVGASITWGAFIENREHFSFPGQLQTLLGNEYQVTNLGVGGCTMLKKGNSPYWKTKEYQQALKSAPDVVFIDLGGNDAKAINRPYLKEINQDCQDMIDAFRQLPSHPRVVVLLPVVSFVTDTTGIWDPAITKLVIPGLQQAAYTKNTEVIDMHQLLINHPEMMPDKIHPNREGSAIMAKRLFEVLMQPCDPDFAISGELPASAQISSFMGYRCADFTMNNRTCKVVSPKCAAPGHPWIWRARFWGHEPQTDVALLERGYHLVYCDVAELFGNKEAVSLWNDFYALLRKAGLAEKVALEGMSRGAVYVLNWAAENPRKVSAVYIDNPLLDMKSWPCGLGKRSSSPDELAAFRKDYNITSDDQLLKFRNSPIDKVPQIVKGKYPILILCADADEAALPDENTLPFEQKVKVLRGNITVMHKPGFKHHPHSFPNPQPIVDFILNAAALKK